jgi:chitosanase
MHKYVPALTDLEKAYYGNHEKPQKSTAALDALGDFKADWSATATSPPTAPAFRACQDRIVDKLYFAPAIATAKRWGLTSALTKAALYDAEIVHGDHPVQRMIEEANRGTKVPASDAAPPPVNRAEESAWLGRFLERRLNVLKGDSTWVESIDRAALYEKLRREGNFDLSAPIITDAKAARMFPTGGYKDSDYPKCTIAEDGTVSGDAKCTRPVGE